MVVPDRNALVLADPGGRPPVVVDLGPGRYAAPAVAGAVVAVVDLDGGRLRTFDPTGTPLRTVDLPPGVTGPERGEDGRLYVDDPQGTATTVVEPDGSAITVATGGTSSATVARAVADLPAPRHPPSGMTDARPPCPGRRRVSRSSARATC